MNQFVVQAGRRRRQVDALGSLPSPVLCDVLSGSRAGGRTWAWSTPSLLALAAAEEPEAIVFVCVFFVLNLRFVFM